MKKSVIFVLLCIIAVQAQAVELPDIAFEPITTADGQPANRLVPESLLRTPTPTGGYDISRITVSAVGQQLNIASPASDNLVIPMLLEDTGLIGMQWRLPDTQLSAAEITAIQPNLDSTHDGEFIHRVSSKHLRRSAEHGQRQMQAFMAKVAYPISIRPLADPTLLPAGSDFPVRLYFAGQPVAGALLTAENKTTGVQQSTRSNSQGIAIVTLEEAGDWRLSYSRIPISSGNAGTLYTAMLEFANQAGGRP